MFKKLSSAVSSLTGSPAPELPPTHRGPARAQAYTQLAKELHDASVPVDTSDCAACNLPCPVGNDQGNGSAGTVVDAGQVWDGQSYEEYVLHHYGDLGHLPDGFEQDWESDLAGSGSAPRGRLVDEESGLAHKLHKYVSTLSLPDDNGSKPKGKPKVEDYVKPATDISAPSLPPPSSYSSSLISQSDDPEDQTVLVFPDWKVVHEVENTIEGAESLYSHVLRAGLGRAGERLQGDAREGTGRLSSWVMPYRAVVLLCSHKRRDKRCHIAAPLLRSALITCLAKHGITVDETGGSLCNLDGRSLEDLEGTEEERKEHVEKQRKNIEGVDGGSGGEVGIFNINHLGGHRYAGVMLILFPSGAYLSYGRVSPQEIPRVVEETILKGKVVPGLLRSAAGVSRGAVSTGPGFLGW
ncbi:Sucrase/ferredoxin-like-domain-containing protein [Papiliotrema laurentii]|uniref:Sucrase/ferredoxin-like-domain-containing protein n=1 Tax=Papiliotrema laurentii TaxID=5418 RepID=A0AAD9L7L3_PAPLA|nr:Sucrase/ferredoxin-like-domain-containing protein [Papiliotrema laurentii]